MDAEALQSLKPEMELFLKRYAPHFGRDENERHARAMVQGLLAGGDRRNVENIAEKVEGGVVRTLQKFISQGVWDDREVLRELRQHVASELGSSEGVLILDETGFPKKGTKSVGVARQYSGTLGCVDNCQVGVFLSYCSPKGHTLCDRRLFLPEVWTNDRARCLEAGIPEGVIFRSKPELAIDMVEQAVIDGLPFEWVTGDSVYGQSPKFVQTVRTMKKWYVVEVGIEAHAWSSAPEMLPVGYTARTGGRPLKKAKPATKPQSIAELISQVPAKAWKTITIAEGSQGPRLYEYAELVVWFSEEGLPAEQPERLLFKRSLGQDPELKYQRSNAPAEIPLTKLATVGGCRWRVEQDFQCGKDECGLDEYETRGWVGWHHHTALSMLSLCFLTLQKSRLGEKTSTAQCTGGPHSTALSAGTSTLGRRRNSTVVTTATTPQRDRQTLPRSAATKATKVVKK